MTPLGLLEDLTRRGVVLTAEADKLRYKAPKGTITPALRGLIEQHRAALLQALVPVEGADLQQASNKPPTALALFPDPRFDDGVAERRFQRLRSADGHDLLLEFDSFVALEARCGELHGRLIDFPHDARLLALYEGYAAAWLLCRGL